MKKDSAPVNKQEAQMQKLEKEAKAAKRKWLLIMFLIMAAFIGIAVGVSLWEFKYAPYAFIFAIVTVAITGKLCMAQLGKVLEKQRNEREKLDTSGEFARFNLK